MEFQRPNFSNFGELLRNSAQRFPNKTALIFKDKRCSYRELEEASNRVASALADMGVVPGDRVGLVSSNEIDFLEVVFGCAKLGAVVVKLNWRLAPGELLRLVEFNEVKLLFYRYQDELWKQEIAPALAGSGLRCVGLDLPPEKQGPGALSYQALKAQGSPEFPITFPGGEAPLMHVHTGGTTGFPKCVVYGHKRYIDHVAANAYALRFYEDMIFQTMSQLFHSASLGVYASLFVGATVILFDRFNPQKYLEAAEKEGTTRLSSVPTVLHCLLNQENIDDFDLHKIKTIGYGSAPMPAELIEAAIEKLGSCDFMQSYGMTEMGATVTILSPEDHVRDHYKHLLSVGKPIPGAQVRIVDEQRRDCPVGTLGEIAVKGYNTMLGYWKMPELTAKCLVDGWYYTQDLGFIDEEGFLTVAGRKSGLIITGGENVFPAEVETALGSHSGVDSVCVFGMPDETWGERVTACVVLKPGWVLTEEELRSWCRPLIAGYKIPKQIEFVEELPESALGKVDKAALVQRFSQKDGQHGAKKG